MTQYIVSAITDEVTACECCGKTNLKRTVAIENSETGEVKFFGTTCATQPQKGFDLDKEVKRAIAEFDSASQLAWSYASRQYRNEGGTYSGNGRDGWKPDDKALITSIYEMHFAAIRKNTAQLTAAN